MIGQLKQFSIYDLWGEKQVHLKFHDNKLILVGENGSGKTTILRIVYETLACKWPMLSVKNFSKIELSFSADKPITIFKSKIQDAKYALTVKMQLCGGVKYGRLFSNG